MSNNKKPENPGVCLNEIPSSPEGIKVLAKYAFQNLDPKSPEHERVVFILNLASKRLESLGL